MARRFRKFGTRRRRSRRRLRRRSGVRKALRRVASLSRKMAGEVKKIDHNAIITETQFTQITNALGTAADNASSLPDFGYVYKVISSASTSFGQGLQLGDWVGEQIRAKYVYIGIHVQMPVRPSDTESSAATIQQPLCLRCMIVQDRNYNDTLSTMSMTQNLFGLQGNTSGAAMGYLNRADYTLLPINPQEPGRFKVIRDFKMFVAPGWRQDYYKKIMLLQRDLLSGGRFYAGADSFSTAEAPGQSVNTWANMRNGLYLVFYYQSPTLYGVNQTGTPDFTISVQSRLAFYDN